MISPQNPVLSVVVAIVSDTTDPQAGVGHLAECLRALSHQVEAPPMELIVPYHEKDVDGIESLQNEFSHVNFVPSY